MGRLVDFLSSSARNRNQRVIQVDEKTIDLVAADGSLKTRFTLDRETATGNDEYDLMGLDHPILQDELGRWRSVPPESLGVAVEGNGIGPAVLSIWMVETSNSAGEHKSTVQAVAVNIQGTRLPAIERQVDVLLRANPIRPTLSVEQRLDLFSHHVEPTLQRELKHKGSANGDGSYGAELIGYIEIA